MKCPNCSAKIDTMIAYCNAESYGDRQMLVACGKCGSGVSFFAERIVRFSDVETYRGDRVRDDWGEPIVSLRKKAAKP